MHKQQLCDMASFRCREEAIISVFENNTNAVVNVFDVTLQVRCGPAVLTWHVFGRTVWRLILR